MANPSATQLAAAAYVGAGMAIIPIPTGLKGPRSNGWQLRESAVTTPAQILAMGEGNIGLAHRWADPPTCSLDVDDVSKAMPWLASHGIDLTALLDAPDAVQIVSGRENRAKLLYRLPADTTWLPTYQLPKEGLEFRCANRQGTTTVQDVLPPSIHPDTGLPYQWGGLGNWQQFPVLPNSLFDLWRRLGEVGSSRENLTNLSEGGRNNALASLGGGLRRCGLGQEEIGTVLSHLNEAVCSPPLPEREVLDIARGMIRYAPSNQSSEETGHLRRVDLEAILLAELPEPGFLIPPLLPRRQVTLLGGHGGIGKSMLALTMAAHVAAGRSFAGFEASAPARVAVLSFEDDRTIVLPRLRHVFEHFNLPAAALQNLQLSDCSEGLGALMTEGAGYTGALEATPLLLEVKEAANGADFVVIDNASETFDGNENVRRQVRQFMRALKEIGTENDACILLLAHIDKASALRGSKENSYSGSTAWHNSARSRLALVYDETGGIELRHEKSNLSQLAAPVRLTRAEFGVLVPVPNSVRDAQIKQQQAADNLSVLEALDHAARKAISVPVAITGVRTSWGALNEATDLPAHLALHKPGKRLTEEALRRLAQSGLIACVVRSDRHRRKKDYWELAMV